jgi:hypothetical protein
MIHFGTITLTNAGYGDAFLVKYDAAGNVIWAKSAGSSGEDNATSVTNDNSGYCYIAGFFTSPVLAFGTTDLTNHGSGTHDIFATEYAPDREVVWAHGAGGTGADDAYSVATDGSRNSFIAGYIGSPTVSFGTTTLTSHGTTDLFVAKSDNTPATGTGDLKPDNILSVFPNPAKDYLWLKVAGDFTAEILNSQGSALRRDITENNIDITDLPSGIFLIKVTKGNNILTKKFIKR